MAKRFSEEEEAEAPPRPARQPRAEAPRAAAATATDAPAIGTGTGTAADVFSVSCELDVDADVLEGEALDRRPAEGGWPCGVAGSGGPSLFVTMRGGVRLAVSSELELPFPVYLNPQLFQPGYKPPREPRAADAAATQGKRGRPSARPSAAAARGAAAGAAVSDAAVEAVPAEAEGEAEGEAEAELVSVEVPSPALNLGGRGERGHPFAAAAVARDETKPRPRRPAFGLGAKPAFKLPRPPRPPARAGLQCEGVAWRLRGAGRCFASAIVVGAAVEARCGLDV